MRKNSLANEGKFIYLLGLIILYVLMTSFISSEKNYERWTGSVLSAIFIILILFCVHIMSHERKFFYYAIGFAVISLLSHLLILAKFSPECAYLSLIFYLSNIFFLTIVTTTTLYMLLQKVDISADVLFGAVSGYFLLGFTWGFVYLLIGSLDHHAFSVYLIEQSMHTTIQNFFYYSFATMTTIGADPILPVSNIARTCSWLEAMNGQMYLAVWISHLVGLRLQQKVMTTNPPP